MKCGGVRLVDSVLSTSTTAAIFPCKWTWRRA